MKISEESARHLDTAILLMEGVKESLSAEPDEWDVFHQNIQESLSIVDVCRHDKNSCKCKRL